jgi:hypothetical protein
VSRPCSVDPTNLENREFDQVRLSSNPEVRFESKTGSTSRDKLEGSVDGSQNPECLRRLHLGRSTTEGYYVELCGSNKTLILL